MNKKLFLAAFFVVSYGLFTKSMELGAPCPNLDAKKNNLLEIWNIEHVTRSIEKDLIVYMAYFRDGKRLACMKGSLNGCNIVSWCDPFGTDLIKDDAFYEILEVIYNNQ